MAKFKFPPGVYCTPNDYDLIEFFLKPKVLGHNLAFDIVEEKQVYGPDCSPWKIFDPNHLDFWFVHPTKNSEIVRYVFTNLSKIGKGGGGEEMRSRSRSRVNMSKRAGSGTWVGETGKDKIMDCRDNVIGETRLLVFKINEIDPAAGEAQFGYYKMHEYCLSGIYGNFDPSSTLVLCKITYDSSKKCPSIKKNLSSVCKIPAVVPKPKRVSAKSSKKQQSEKNLEGSASDHLVEGSVCDSLARTVSDNLEGGAGDYLVGGCVCDSLARTVSDNFDSGAGANLVGVQCAIESAEDLGLDYPRVDFGVEGSLSDNLVTGSAADSLVGVQNFTEFGEDLGLDYPPVNFCFGGSEGHDPVEGSVCDYLDVPNMNEFGDDLDLDDLHVGFRFEDEWIRELINPIQEERVQDSTMTNLRKRKFESENSCMAKKAKQLLGNNEKGHVIATCHDSSEQLGCFNQMTGFLNAMIFKGWTLLMKEPYHIAF